MYTVIPTAIEGGISHSYGESLVVSGPYGLLTQNASHINGLAKETTLGGVSSRITYVGDVGYNMSFEEGDNIPARISLLAVKRMVGQNISVVFSYLQIS